MRNIVNEDVQSLSLLFFPDSEAYKPGKSFSNLDFRTPFSLKLLFLYFPIMHSMTIEHTWCRYTTYETPSTFLPFVTYTQQTRYPYFFLPQITWTRLTVTRDFSVERTERDLINARENHCWRIHNKGSCQVKSRPRDRFSRYSEE